ncbi:hypothetical protein [Candidatus Fokinia crypta]|uniref:Uncharacterized protein n=1 Tax=Candidatus Fokinia crypta TaxID=1920990 RepID=A0ABZ0US13_9RICK|nr:hypothetical protein [Candidatus Fokinia cryptica]WPX97938.1 hypothetical protein Fokcrypt_00462 [Candidatus Fokinia cryptica]
MDLSNLKLLQEYTLDVVSEWLKQEYIDFAAAIDFGELLNVDYADLIFGNQLDVSLDFSDFQMISDF